MKVQDKLLFDFELTSKIQHTFLMQVDNTFRDVFHHPIIFQAIIAHVLHTPMRGSHINVLR